MMRSAIVTGGAGFIGSHVLESLSLDRWKCVAIDNLSTGLEQNVPRSVSLEVADVTSPDLRSMVRIVKPQVIVHLAAQVSVGESVADAMRDSRTNVLGTVNVLEAARENGSAVILASSAAVYGTPRYLPIDELHPVAPLSPYGAAKLAAEQYLAMYSRGFRVPTCALRFANVYGPRQRAGGDGGVIAKFMQALFTGTTPVFYGSGLQTRDFVFVRDVAEAVQLLCRLLPSETEPRFEPINISSGRQTTIAELYQLLQSAIRVDRAPIIDKPRPGDIQDSCLANDRARDALGWAPRWSLPDGIAATFQASDYASAQVAEG